MYTVATHHQRGFTIIETLIYLGLFSIIMGGAVVTCYGIFESASRSITKAMVQEEGSFVVGKIDWALSGAQGIVDPAVGGTGASLSVNKWDTSIGNPITIAASGTVLTLARGAAQAQLITNDNVSISNLSFTHTFAGGVNPESVSASFTMSAHTPSGAVVSQDFSTVVYVRK